MLYPQNASTGGVQPCSFQCAELVPVRWTVGPGQEYSEHAILAEISVTGGVFLVETPAEPGTRVCISLPKAELQGVVRSCIREEFSYALDVAVEGTPQWFGGTYQPEVLPREARFVLPLAS